MGARALVVALVLLSGCASPAESQSRGPSPGASGPGRVDVAWSVAHVGSTVLVEVRATVEPGWHIYGLTSEYGVPPALELELPPEASLVGALVEPPPVAELALDELPITAHRGTVAFVQALSVATATRVPARFRWQVCNDPDTYCSPGVSEVTLLLPGPEGRVPGTWEVAPGLWVGLLPPHARARNTPFDNPSLYVLTSGVTSPWVDVAPPPGVSRRIPIPAMLDAKTAAALGREATPPSHMVVVGLLGQTGGSLTVRIEHLGVTRTVVLPFVP